MRGETSIERRTVTGKEIVEELHASGDVVRRWMDLAKIRFFLLNGCLEVDVRHIGSK